MTTFDERDKGFENKFAHDEAIKFKLANKARINTAKWAATKMGYDQAQTEILVDQIISLGVGKKNEDAIISKIVDDSKALDKAISKAEIEKYLALAYSKAEEELKSK